MDKNREITRIKREEIRRLKEHLSLLQQRMERYLLISLFLNSNQEVLLHFLFWLVHAASIFSVSDTFLSRYMCYGSGPKRLPLADVLQYALEFASSKPMCMSPVDNRDSSAPPGGATGQLCHIPRFLKKIIVLLVLLIILLIIYSGTCVFNLCHYPNMLRPNKTYYVFTTLAKNETIVSIIFTISLKSNK